MVKNKLNANNYLHDPKNANKRAHFAQNTKNNNNKVDFAAH